MGCMAPAAVFEFRIIIKAVCSGFLIEKVFGSGAECPIPGELSDESERKMSEAEKSVKFVPAACPKCGGKLEVDPSQEAAVCQYCGTPFIVDKAIQNYNIQNAKIDHVDTVKVDMKGSVDSVIGFVERQIDKSREDAKEEKKVRDEESKEFLKNSWKIFLVMFAAMIVIWVIGNALGMFK